MDENNMNEETNEVIDPIKQVEQQFNTRIQEQDTKFRQLFESQQELINAINNLGAQKRQVATETEEDITQLLIADPSAAVKKITERVKRDVDADLNKRNSAAQEEAVLMNSLKSEYPELTQMDHPLTQAALDIYGKMSKREQESPLAYKLAVSEAALKTSIRPKSQRKADDTGDFSLSNRSGGNRPKGEKLDKGVLEFAARMGLNTADPKVVESLKKRMGL